MRNFDLNIIIQGPLVSKGKGASNIGKRKNEAPQVEFDCTDCINLNIMRIARFLPGTKVTIVITDGLKFQTPNENVEVIYDDYKFSGLENIRDRNKFRQFSSIFKGFNNSRYTLKIRTDMEFNWEKLSLAIHKINLNSFIYINFMHRNEIEVPDFVFLAKTDLLRKFVLANLREKIDFVNNVHTDMTLKFIYFCHFHDVKVPHWVYFLRCKTFPTKRNTKIFKYAFENIYRSLPIEFFPIQWRGEAFHHDYIDYISENYLWTGVNKLNIISEKKLPKLNFLRYLYVRRLVGRRLIIFFIKNKNIAKKVRMVMAEYIRRLR